MNLTVSGIQLGPYAGTTDDQLAKILSQGRSLLNVTTPDLLVFPELMSSPYFALEEHPRWFEYAEDIPGPTTETMGTLARESGCYVTGSLFHRVDGKYYNTAALLRPDGSLDELYSKTHIPNIQHGTTRGLEKFYFAGGERFSIWNVKSIKVGILICYDRSFPEAWRALSLRGAQVVVVLASSSGFRSEAFVHELQVRAMENGVWVVAVNKGGNETFVDAEYPADFYGSSCVIGPEGNLKLNTNRQPDQSFTFDLDMDQVSKARAKLGYFDARRPDLYAALIERTS